MFRLFRKTRQNLIGNRKLLKYLTYAAGEILLVIIGILAALQINNWSEEQKNHKKTKEILKQIRSDLRTNIIEAANVASFYFYKDSLMHTILRNEIDYFDFDNRNLGAVRSFTTTRLPLTLLDNGFQNWADQEKVPQEFQELNEPLNKLFVDLQARINYNEEKMGSIIDGNLKYFSENFAWFSKRVSRNLTEKEKRNEAAYFQYDSLYKNRVTFYGIYAINNQLPLVDMYRMASIDAYSRINELLSSDNATSTDEPFLLSNKQLSKLTGTYQDPDFTEVRPVISAGENSIIYTSDNSSIEFMPLSPHVFFTTQLGDPVMIYFQLRGDSVYAMHGSQYGIYTELTKVD